VGAYVDSVFERLKRRRGASAPLQQPPEPPVAGFGPPEPPVAGFGPPEPPVAGFGPPEPVTTLTPGVVRQAPLDTSDEPGPRGEAPAQPRAPARNRELEAFREQAGPRDAFYNRILLLLANASSAAADAVPESLRMPVSRRVYSERPLTPAQVQGERSGDDLVERIRSRADASQREHPVASAAGDLAALAFPLIRVPGVGAAGTRGAIGAMGPVSRGTGLAGAAGRALGPMAGRAVQNLGTAVPLGAAAAAIYERDPARRGEAAVESVPFSLALGSAGTLAGEASRGLYPRVRDMASRAYGRRAAGGYVQGARAAEEMGLERYGDVARELDLGRSGRAGLQHARQTEAQTGQAIGNLVEELPPANLQPVVQHLYNRSAALRRLGESQENLGAIEERALHVVSPDRQEALAQRLQQRDRPPPSLARILEHVRTRGEEVPFAEMHGTRRLLGDQLERPTVEGRHGAAAEMAGTYGAYARELGRTAENAGRGDAWRRANERYEASTIARQGQQTRAQHADTATLWGIRSGLAGLVQSAANRSSHRIVSSVADILHSIVRRNPEALGVYGPAFMQMQRAHGDTGTAAEHYRLSTTDPAYSAATDENED